MGTPRSPLRLLLVMDESRERFLLREALLRRPEVGEVRAVSEGEAALDSLFLCRVRDPNFLPDALVVEQGLAGMEGVEILRFLRAEPLTAALPFFLLVAEGDRLSRRVALAGGARGVFVRPLGDEEAGELVATLVRGQADQGGVE